MENKQQFELVSDPKCCPKCESISIKYVDAFCRKTNGRDKIVEVWECGQCGYRWQIGVVELPQG